MIRALLFCKTTSGRYCILILFLSVEKCIVSGYIGAVRSVYRDVSSLAASYFRNLLDLQKRAVERSNEVKPRSLNKASNAGIQNDNTSSVQQRRVLISPLGISYMPLVSIVMAIVYRI